MDGSLLTSRLSGSYFSNPHELACSCRGFVPPSSMTKASHGHVLLLVLGSALYWVHSAAQQIGAVPFRLEKSLPYVTCTIGNSGPLNCLLDTGSAMTGVSRDTARQLKLSTHVDPTLPRQDVAVQALDRLSLHIGTISWSAQRTSIAPADLEMLDKDVSPSFHTDVVIGTELLDQCQLILDPDALEARFLQPGTPPPPSAEKLNAFVLGIPLALMGLKTAEGHAAIGPFAIDTGSRPALMLSGPFWSKQPKLAFEGSVGPHGETVTLSAIRIAHSTMSHVEAIMPSKGSGLLASEKVGGVIGGPILRHFVVVYDLPNKSMWMMPSKRNPPQ